MTDPKDTAKPLDDSDLEDAQGGIALLLPAVQAAREPASLSNPAEPKGEKALKHKV